MATASHYAQLAGLKLVLWLDGVACKGAAAEFESIKKVTKDGEFVWFAPAASRGTWRGFKVPFDLLPNGLATTVEISVGEDGEKVRIPLKVNTNAASARGSAELLMGDNTMIGDVILKQHTVTAKGAPVAEPFITVTPRVHRPNQGNSTPPNTPDEIFGS